MANRNLRKVKQLLSLLLITSMLLGMIPAPVLAAGLPGDPVTPGTDLAQGEGELPGDPAMPGTNLAQGGAGLPGDPVTPGGDLAQGGAELPGDPVTPGGDLAQGEAELPGASLAQPELQAPAAVAGEIVVIQTPAELAALGGKALIGSYQLGADLDMAGETMNPISSLVGTFEGNGHTISNLAISYSGSAGLFGILKSDSAVSNLLFLDCTIAASSGSGVGTLAGEVQNRVAVTNCGVDGGTVSGTGSYTNSGGLLGQISYGTGVVISGCYSKAAVSGKYRSGGLLGNVSGSVVSLENCYAAGDVTNTNSSSGAAGGLVGYVYCSGSSYSLDALHCYAAGTVTGKGGYGFANVSNNGNGSFANCHYDVTKNTMLQPTDGKYAGITGQTTENLQGLAPTLGSGFLADPQGGYPLLKWQDQTVYHPVTLTVNVATAQVVVLDQNKQEMTAAKKENGTFSYGLAAGDYTYTVAAFGKIPVAGKFTVGAAGLAQPIFVELAAAPTQTLKIKVGYEDGNPKQEIPNICLRAATDPQQQISPVADGSYLLPAGDYIYTLTAPGYRQIRGTVTVGVQAVELTLEFKIYSGWDGSLLLPEKAAGVYQITTAEELAWFAALVNGTLPGESRQEAGAAAVLTADLDLGDREWTPIGKTADCAYTGKFDGGNHKILGLRVTDNSTGGYGLFGVVSEATIENVLVRGTVTANVSSCNGVGGIAGNDRGGSTFRNCGNEGNVNGNAAGAAGGILGSIYTGTTSQISGCYNQGAIAAAGSQGVGGILGNCSDTVTILNCDNTGAIANTTGSGKVSGIVGSAGFASVLTNCYNTGVLTAKNSGDQYAIGYGSGLKRTNCHVLDTLTVTETAAQVTKNAAQTMKTPAFVTTLGGDAWKADGTNRNAINGGYPVLQWQTIPAGGETELLPLPQPYGDWEHGYTAAGLAYLTTKGIWQNDANAASYTIQLYNWGNQLVGTIPGITTADASYDPATGRFSYDLTGVLQAAGAASGSNDTYQFTVTAIGDGVHYTDSKPSLRSGLLDYVVTKLAVPAEASWQGNLPIARWETTDFAAYYGVTLFKNGVLYQQLYTADTYCDVTDLLTAEGEYTFAVTAFPGNDEKYASEPAAKSAVYHYIPTVTEPEEGQWILLKTPQDLVALGNVKDQATGETDETGNPVNAQTVAWSKNYKLANDLDLADLTAAEVAKGLAIGNTAHPFTGIFDGNGFQIKGLTLSNGCGGLFSYIGQTGVVRNLTIRGANVLYADNAGVLAVTNRGTIRQCAVINSNITADTGAIIGGLVSRNYGTIKESYVLGGSLTANSASGNGHAGFVGGNYGSILECYTTMKVSSGSYSAGGFAGWSDNGGSFTDCFALGDVTATFGWSGGFVGRINDSNSTFTHCYAFNTVTSPEKPKQVYGFVGGLGSEAQEDLSPGWEGSFHPTYPAGSFATCYYSGDTMGADNPKTGAAAKTTAEMSSQAMAALLGANWQWAADQNNGLPYLAAVTPPQTLPTQQIRVELVLGTFDKTNYGFAQFGKPITVQMIGTGNTRVIDVLDAAVAQGLLTYSYGETPTFGRYIHTINGYGVEQPDGWMFTVNDRLSNVSASLASIGDGDRLLWYEGTCENRFQGPTWQELTAGTGVTWTEIATVADLVALSNSTDPAVLAKHYRLMASLDLRDVVLAPIGRAAAPFTGTFDGNGKTLANLTLTGGEGVGLFGVIQGATLKNITLTDAKVSGTKNVGLLVGEAQVKLNLADMNQSLANLIGNCTVAGTVAGNQNVGGLVGNNGGRQDPDTLFAIYSAVAKSTADVRGNTLGQSPTAQGGLVGKNEGYITKSAATGDVYAPAASLVGGLVGSNNGGVYDCSATGAVTGDRVVGGFVGNGSADAVSKNCYSVGAVTGTDSNIGGFAGSYTGKIEDCLSVGTVTPGKGMGGYNGGFAGSFSGKLVGMPHQITFQNSYGNCLAQDGTLLQTFGNSVQFPGEGNGAALAAARLATPTAAGDKLYEMFGVNLPVPQDLAAEAAKYADTFGVANTTAVGTALSCLKEGQTAGAGFTVSFEANGPYLAGGSSLTLAQKNTTVGTAAETITLTVADSAGHRYHKPLTVLLQAPGEAANQLMDAIAATLTTSSNGWAVLDLAAYHNLAGKTIATTPDAYQNTLNLAITEAAGAKTSAGDRARLELVLRAMGIDSTKLYQVNSNKVIDNGARLKDIPLSEMTAYGYYAAPWILLAELQGNAVLTPAQHQGLLLILKNSMGADGLFGYEWDGVSYASPDTAGTVLAAIAPCRETDPVAREMAATIVSGLSAAQGSNGSFGNANTDAMVILGLTALGIDPARDPRFIKNGCSVADGLLSYVNQTNNGFLLAGQENPLATEQGFRGLVALAQFEAKGKQAVNLYDFSGVAVKPGRATAAGEGEKPVEPPATNPDIHVSLLVKTDRQTWLPQTGLTVKDGSTVYHAFVKALDQGKLTYEGAEAGYVESITKNGVTLRAFEHGPNSGWLFQVNGVVPTVGLTSYQLQDGDKIVWYYTADWTTDEGASSNLGGGKPNLIGKSPILEPKALVSQGEATVMVDAGALKDAAAAAKEANAKTIVIVPQGGEDATTVTVNLERSAVAAVADQTTVGLDLQTVLGRVRLTPAGIQALGQTTGRTVTIQLMQEKDGSLTIKILVDGKDFAPLPGGLWVSFPYKTAQPNKGSGAVGQLDERAKSLEKTSQISQPGQMAGNLGNAGQPGQMAGNLGNAGQPGQMAGNLGNAGQPGQMGKTGKTAESLAAAGMVAVTVSADGKAQIVPKSWVTGETVSLWLPAGATVTVENRGQTFGDVPATAWYAPGVAFAAGHGLFQGNEVQAFDPNGVMTRGMVVTVLHRLEGQPVVAGGAAFADVAKDAWYAPGAAWAAEQKIVTGLTAETLAPAAAVSRQELACMLYRYGVICGLAPAPTAALAGFRDQDQVAPWAKEGVAWAVSTGILTGQEQQMLAPAGLASRAEVATMLQRFVALLVK